MTAVLLALMAGAGVHLLYTAFAFGWRGRAPRPGGSTALPRRMATGEWLVQAGLAEVRLREFLLVLVVLGAAGGGIGFLLFAAPFPAAAIGLACATTPLGIYRNRRTRTIEQAREQWPHLIDEIRLRATTLGRSLPQALFEVGAQGPAPLRPAFAAAQREWRLTTDFARTLDVLKARLADPTADVVCETLLIAHELGGTDIGPRLRALAEDRATDVTARKDAIARQAGARFARRFVIIVPVGMALAGSLIGTGRRAYGTTVGQTIVLAALILLALCWLWAGRFLRLPTTRRVMAGVPVTANIGASR